MHYVQRTKYIEKLLERQKEAKANLSVVHGRGGIGKSTIRSMFLSAQKAQEEKVIKLVVDIDTRRFNSASAVEMLTSIRKLLEQSIKEQLNHSRFKSIFKNVFSKTGGILKFVLFDHAKIKLMRLSDGYQIKSDTFKSLDDGKEVAEYLDSASKLFDWANAPKAILQIFTLAQARSQKWNVERILSENSIVDKDADYITEQLPLFIALDLKRIFEELNINFSLTMVFDEFEVYEQSRKGQETYSFIQALEVLVQNLTPTCSVFVFSRTVPLFSKQFEAHFTAIEVQPFNSSEKRDFIEKNGDSSAKMKLNDINNTYIPDVPFYLNLWCKNKGRVLSKNDLLELYLKNFKGESVFICLLSLCEVVDENLFNYLSNRHQNYFKDFKYEHLIAYDWVRQEDGFVGFHHELSDIAKEVFKSDRKDLYLTVNYELFSYWLSKFAKEQRFENSAKAFTHLEESFGESITNEQGDMFLEFAEMLLIRSKKHLYQGDFSVAWNFCDLGKKLISLIKEGIGKSRNHSRFTTLSTHFAYLSAQVLKSPWRNKNIEKARNVLLEEKRQIGDFSEEYIPLHEKVSLRFLDLELALLLGDIKHESKNSLGEKIAIKFLINSFHNLRDTVAPRTKEELGSEFWQAIYVRLIYAATKIIKTNSQEIEQEVFENLIEKLGVASLEFDEVKSFLAFSIVIYETRFSSNSQRIIEALQQQEALLLKRKPQIEENWLKSKWAVGRKAKREGNEEKAYQHGLDVYTHLSKHIIEQGSVLRYTTSQELRRLAQSWNWINQVQPFALTANVRKALNELIYRLSNSGMAAATRGEVIEVLGYVYKQKNISQDEQLVQSLFNIPCLPENHHIQEALINLKLHILQGKLEEEELNIPLLKQLSKLILADIKLAKVPNSLRRKAQYLKINSDLEILKSEDGEFHKKISRISKLIDSLEYHAKGYYSASDDNRLLIATGNAIYEVARLAFNNKNRKVALSWINNALNLQYHQNNYTLEAYLESFKLSLKIKWDKQQQWLCTKLSKMIAKDPILGSTLFRLDKLTSEDSTTYGTKFAARLLVYAINRTEAAETISLEQAELLYTAKQEYIRILWKLYSESFSWIVEKADGPTRKGIVETSHLPKERFLQGIINIFANVKGYNVDQFGLFFGRISKITSEGVWVDISDQKAFIPINQLSIDLYNKLRDHLEGGEYVELDPNEFLSEDEQMIALRTLKYINGKLTAQNRSDYFVTLLVEFYYPGLLKKRDFRTKGIASANVFMGGSNSACVIRVTNFEQNILLAGGDFLKYLCEVLHLRRLMIFGGKDKKASNEMKVKEIIDFTNNMDRTMLVDKSTLNDETLKLYYQDDDQRKLRTFEALFKKVFKGRKVEINSIKTLL